MTTDAPGRADQAPVLVTGAGGLIGHTLCARLEELGHTVLRLDLAGPEIDCECDLTDPEAIRSTLADIGERYDNRIGAIVHLAAYFDFSGEPHPLYQKLNVDGTRYLLEALADYDVGRFVYTSTMLVHAPTEPGIPIEECSPLEAKWAYPISKLAAERTIVKTVDRLAESGRTREPIPYSLLRLAGLYHQDCGSPTLSHQIKRIYEHELTSHFYAGDPATGQAFVHLEDAVEAIALAVDKREELPDRHVALIGEADVMSYQALNNAISQGLFGEPLPVTRMPDLAAKAGAEMMRATEKVVPDSIDQGDEPFIRPYMIDLAEDHYEIDPTRAEQTLGFRARHRLRDELPVILRRLKEDPRRFYEKNGLQPPAWMTRFDRAQDEDPDRWRDVLERREADEHRQFLWVHLTTLALGGWLVVTPWTAGAVAPGLAWTEVLIGAAIMVASAFALNRRMRWARWLNAALGLALAFAPLVFLTGSAASYLNDTLVGVLVACLALGARPVLGPGIAARADPTAIPPGWEFSPSTWLQRLPIIGLALVGLFISRYLAAFQLGQTDAAWDPFFGDGTERIITSRISEAWPVPDAGLGAYVYLLEIFAGVVGTQRRWRTMPWLVLLFGILIVPLGAVSIYFIIIQPILIGTWCSLCLLAAAAMLLQIPYSFDEILATLQFLRQRQKAGTSWFRVLLLGDAQAPPGQWQAGSRSAADAAGSVPQPGILEQQKSIAGWLGESLFSGVSVPWTLIVSAALGIGLMCTRLIADTTVPLANSDHVLGSLVVVVSISALAEMGRPLRFINMLLGVALIGAPFIFAGGSSWGIALDVLVGLALIGLAVPRGPIRNHYGDFDRYIL